MATMTLTITNGGNTYGATKTVSSQDLTRLLAAYEGLFGVSGATAAGAAWAGQLLSVTKDTVRRFEHQAAITAAGAGVTEISLT